MLNALLIGNPRSGTADRLREVDVPGRWVLDPADVSADDVRRADVLAFYQKLAAAAPLQVTVLRRKKRVVLRGAR